MSNIKNLEKCCSNLFEGEISIQEFIQNHSDEQVLKAEKFLTYHPKYIEEIPFYTDCDEYNNHYRTNDGAKILQAMIDNWD